MYVFLVWKLTNQSCNCFSLMDEWYKDIKVIVQNMINNIEFTFSQELRAHKKEYDRENCADLMDLTKPHIIID